MGKIRIEGEATERKHDSVKSLKKKTPKSLPGAVILPDPTVNQPKVTAKKYVSPLNLSWKRNVRHTDPKCASGALAVESGKTETPANDPTHVPAAECNVTHKTSEPHEKRVRKKHRSQKKSVDLLCLPDDSSSGSKEVNVVNGDVSTPTFRDEENAAAHRIVEPVERREEKSGVLFKIKPSPATRKQKRKKPGRKEKSDLDGDEACFLGTGISSRPPIGNVVVGGDRVPALPPVGEPAGQCQPSVYGSNFVNPDAGAPKTGLRPIIIDGSNIAMGHGRSQFFSSRGIELCVNYFASRGHQVFCFLPQYRKTDPGTRDRHLLDQLEKQGQLVCTPSRSVDGNNVAPYDDRYIVQIAAELGGIIVSRDKFTDLLHESPVFRETILRRTLMYTWVGDILMFPTDPFGKSSVTLDQMLRF